MLLSELDLNVGIDPNDMSVQDAVKKVKGVYKTAAASPSRAMKMRQQALSQQKKEIQQSENDPLQGERLAIQTLEDRLAKMKMSLAKKEQQIAQQTGTEEPGVEGGEEGGII